MDRFPLDAAPTCVSPPSLLSLPRFFPHSPVSRSLLPPVSTPLSPSPSLSFFPSSSCLMIDRTYRSERTRRESHAVTSAFPGRQWARGSTCAVRYSRNFPAEAPRRWRRRGHTAVTSESSCLGNVYGGLKKKKKRERYVERVIGALAGDQRPAPAFIAVPSVL